jgi:hypothetical protein
MNARMNDSDDKSGKLVIPYGETTKHYNAMLLQALAQKTEQSTKTQRDIATARANLRRRDNAFRSWFTQTPLSIEETSPATAYVQHLEEIEQAPTTLLSPLPPQQTDMLDISLEPTRIEANWNPYDLLAEMQCSPVIERRQKITIQLEGDELRTLHFVNGILSAQELLETAIAEYLRQYGILPELVRISPSTLLRIDGRCYWTQGDLTYYRSPYGPCPIQIDITLDHMTVQCEEAERTN